MLLQALVLMLVSFVIFVAIGTVMCILVYGALEGVYDADLPVQPTPSTRLLKVIHKTPTYKLFKWLNEPVNKENL